MNLGDVKRATEPRKRRKRVGRGQGSGHGKTCGRGHKGQQSRSGYSRRYGHEGGQMPLFRRLPKRGFTNARFRVDYAIVNLSDLRQFDAGSTVDLDAIKAKGLVPRKSVRLKILAKGELDRKLTVKAHKFSAKASEAITAAGGSIEEISA